MGSSLSKSTTKSTDRRRKLAIRTRRIPRSNLPVCGNIANNFLVSHNQHCPASLVAGFQKYYGEEISSRGLAGKATVPDHNIVWRIAKDQFSVAGHVIPHVEEKEFEHSLSCLQYQGFIDTGLHTFDLYPSMLYDCSVSQASLEMTLRQLIKTIEAAVQGEEFILTCRPTSNNNVVGCTFPDGKLQMLLAQLTERFKESLHAVVIMRPSNQIFHHLTQANQTSPKVLKRVKVATNELQMLQVVGLFPMDNNCISYVTKTQRQR